MDHERKDTTGIGDGPADEARRSSAQQPTIPPHGRSGEPTNASPGALAAVPASTGTVAVVSHVSSVATVAIGRHPRPPGAAATAQMTQPAGEPDMFIGQELCGYTILRKLAEGGMGVVYEGVHGRIGRRGAIKVLKLEFCRSEDVVERFHQEARAVNAIQHENIVNIYDFGRDAGGRVFFVMEYLDGEPLSGRIRRGVLSWSEALPILEQTLRALKAAHDKGFVHRDLKPDNIWLRYVDGKIQVKLLDFGIAKLVGSDGPREKLTRTGSVIGTPHYMSPEQINGSKDVDQRTDLYAMGVITYEMFAGVTPFAGDTLQAVITGHLFGEPPRLAELPANLGVPAPIAEMVDRMLAKDPAARYRSVADVLDDLRAVQGNRRPAKADTLGRTRPLRPPAAERAPARSSPVRRPRAIARWTLAAFAVAGLVVAAVAIGTSHDPVPAPRIVVPQSPHTPIPPTPPVPALPADPLLRERATTTMQAGLTDAEPGVRKYVAEALGAAREQAMVRELTQLAQADPDEEVRGRAAYALGALGAKATAPALAKHEITASAPLKVWYASALARFGDPRAASRLLGYARDRDLNVSLAACLNLADVTRPGDARAIAALRAIATRENELNRHMSYGGLVILAKAAALRDQTARKALYAALDDASDRVRFAAAAQLARIGDDVGREVLRTAFADQGSPDRLPAAVTLIALGEYAGLDLMLERLGDEDAGARGLAARGLGEIGERSSLAPLVGAIDDKDGIVRAAAAAAVLAIVGLEPAVLAQASINWTRSALESHDATLRRAAAGVLADLPARAAVPLFASAFADPSREVRLIAFRSAGRIKSREVAQQVAALVENEVDPEIKEQQVKALGQIGDPVAQDVLARISSLPGRVGVLAGGMRIAVGDVGGLSKLEVAITAPEAELRLAAVESASAANNAIVVPTLKLGLLDRLFKIRFAAAEGLAVYGAEEQDAVPVLKAAVQDTGDATVLGRALAALARFGHLLTDLARRTADMIEDPDPRQRLAAIPAVRALAVAQRLPVLRRLLVDPDVEVRRTAVDAIEDLATRDKEPEQAARLCRPLVSDADEVVRARASGQLSRIRPKAPAAGTKLATPVPADPAADARLEQAIAQRLAEATAAAAEVSAAREAVDRIASDVEPIIGLAAADEVTVQRAKQLQIQLKEATARLDAAASKVAAITTAAGDLAGASPPAAAGKRLADVRRLANDARLQKHTTAARVSTLQSGLEEFRKNWTPGLQLLLDSAKLRIDQGDLAVATAKLAEAARLVRRAGTQSPRLDDLYAELYIGMARNTENPADKRAHLRRAEEIYRRIAQTATGPRAQDAAEHLKAIGEELQ
jgi:serine/threonine protein kinase/HEAT repeat protein